PYQQECIDEIESHASGSYVVQMATGLGKTVTFANIPRHGRVLILAHREELVHQPVKYYDCPVGIEMANETSNGEDVVIASVQSLIHRLNKFTPTDFDTLITDECQHAAAASYRKIYGYFKPRLHLGFSATPQRGDKVRLNDIYQDIIFQRDLRWGITNGYLSDIFCKRVHIDYDLRRVKLQRGDYAPGELEKAMKGTGDAIAQAYREEANGSTLIFAASVDHAHEIASRIPGAAVVTGDTKNRAEIVRDFTDGKIPVIVNVMVFTEGTDIPRVETVMIARPTHSETLYCQMVGRGTRLYEGKDKLTLIDCVGITGKASLCTAPTLLGIDADEVPNHKRDSLVGNLFDLPVRAAAAVDEPESWVKNVEIVNLWAKDQDYDLHHVNWFKMPDGSMKCCYPDGQIVIPCPDTLGRVWFEDRLMPMQEALDKAYVELSKEHDDCRPIWHMSAAQATWGNDLASEKQIALIKKKCKGFNTDGLTKFQASQILNRVI
ncbi:MAG: DEAD/DEAH box helicase, partial [Coprobacillus sp.]|nr:DEAD/DEAH box helicase [Coprobacillus sp.]